MGSLKLIPDRRAAFVDLLGRRDVDVLRSVPAVVYDAAIKTQIDEHIGIAPHEPSEERRDQRKDPRARVLNTRAGSLDLEIPRPRTTKFRPPVIDHSPGGYV